MNGLQLQIRRIEAGIRQYRLAAALDIPQATLSYWENNRRCVPPGMEERILETIEDLRRSSELSVEGQEARQREQARAGKAKGQSDDI